APHGGAQGAEHVGALPAVGDGGHQRHLVEHVVQVRVGDGPVRQHQQVVARRVQHLGAGGRDAPPSCSSSRCTSGGGPAMAGAAWALSPLVLVTGNMRPLSAVYARPSASSQTSPGRGGHSAGATRSTVTDSVSATDATKPWISYDRWSTMSSPRMARTRAPSMVMSTMSPGLKLMTGLRACSPALRRAAPAP